MKKIFLLIAVCLPMFMFTACDGGSPDFDDYGEQGESRNYNIYNTNKLKRTSWKLVSIKRVYNDGHSVDDTPDGTNIISFSDVVVPEIADPYICYIYVKRTNCKNSNDNIYSPSIIGYWYCVDDNLYQYGRWYDDEPIEAGQVGAAWRCLGPGCLILQEATSSKLVYRDAELSYVYDKTYGTYCLFTYSQVSYVLDGSDPDSGGGNTTNEKPEIGFYDYTATKSSLKIQYRIYNQDEANVTSAKIYYGKSSPSSSISATVSGSMITATISGLSSSTTYYIKCTATGKSGTTTSDVTKCMTN